MTGPGRSGTSLCTQLLFKAGARISQNLLPLSAQNPGKMYEDAEIVDIQKQLMLIVYYHGLVAKPGNWMELREVRRLYWRLRDIVVRQANGAKDPWIVKDPRISMLMPLWLRMARLQELKPIYFFCFRNPFAIQHSLHTQYGTDAEQAELIWLMRSVSFLHHARCKAYIVRYEDWFRRPYEQLRGMARYARLNTEEARLRRIVREIVKPELDRSRTVDGLFALPESERIHAALQDLSGSEFKRPLLNRVVDDAYEGLARSPLLARMIGDRR